ncbi:outer membrane beta-barrel domain-containing protein [Paraglaciecola arctica]|uniref:outer membrane beta-barrel domain-containing protein n=1 Tax=Paraglaciecola arctica TaxID=1128911 RepID=UPI001C072A63|nr:outer membrane beta-barrel domain-containing protein [Paraglaciecola arctica]MBU3004761.1 outer membrane beta-barrel domain-containing protein [Paraglaciecola arctica]
MDIGIRSFFLALSITIMSFSLFAEQQTQRGSGQEAPNKTQQSVIEPTVERRDINEANIDSENFEFGVLVGVLSVEDFSSSMVLGVRAAYHVNENFFVEATYGQADAGETSFEVLSGGAPFLTDDERNYRYYNLSLGYNLNGETFFTDRLVFNSATYFTVGAGSTEFGGDERFTLSLGAGYRLLLTDYFALHVNLKDHLFNSELIGEEKTTHNIEYGLGATFFF